jgi:hypothetical protein
VAAISPVTLWKSLGMEGGVTVFKPLGRSVYYVFFRHRGRQVSRSCGTAEYSAAVTRAAEIAAEVVRPQAVGMGVRIGELPGEVQPRKDASVEEVIALFDEWRSVAKPGEKRPRPETATGYRRRLRQLCRLVDADTVADLAAKLDGFSSEKASVSESNFATLIRNAAAIFGALPRGYYAAKGVVIGDPFGGCVPAAPEMPVFEAPGLTEIEVLKTTARNELKTKHTR